MANIITGSRILCATALLFCRPYSSSFYVLYISAGVSDMVDGAVARKTNTSSEFGARLDTTADFIFVVVCLIKLLPILNIPVWLSIWTAVIALVKVSNIVSGYVLRKGFVAVHSVMNKITGFLLFILPLTLRVLSLNYSGTVVCAVASLAAVQEGHYIRTGRMKELINFGIINRNTRTRQIGICKGNENAKG